MLIKQVVQRRLVLEGFPSSINYDRYLVMIENEKNTISKLDKEVAVIKTEISEIKDNHLAHIKKDIDRILYILGAVGLAVLGELFILLNKVL